MKREKINKEDVFEQYGWKPEDGDYINTPPQTKQF